MRQRAAMGVEKLASRQHQAVLTAFRISQLNLITNCERATNVRDHDVRLALAAYGLAASKGVIKVCSR